MSGEGHPRDERSAASIPPWSDGEDELLFGEVQDRQADHRPERPMLSPALDGHLAVVKMPRAKMAAPQPPAPKGPAGRGRGGDRESAPTEVYVELATFLDMQEHAAEDTSIELGGLLLGHRGEGEEGQPWVMICDSLRARHYRATRGSFRFTHETWADLNQQRAELPESTGIVGWYHTHPGWGVFLSDQDVFICDHFFAGPDDVALVIDPTSGDTGLFVRRGSPSGRPPRRLDEYHLYAHRRREPELQAWASFFSGVASMSKPPAVFPSSPTPPIVVTTGAAAPGSGRMWLALAAGVWGTQLAIGLALLLVVWSVSLSSDPVATGPPAASDAVQIREAVVDDLLRTLAVEGPAGAARHWRETEVANEQLRAANLGLLSRVDSLSDQLQGDQRRLQQSSRELTAARDELAAAQSRLAALEEAAPADEDTGAGFDWRVALAGAMGGLLLGWLIGLVSPRKFGGHRGSATVPEGP